MSELSSISPRVSVPKLTNDEDERNLVRVARMYFLDDKTQQEIAETFGVSRFTVGRWLRRARESGLVRIEIVSTDSSIIEIGGRVEQALGLRQCIVVAPENGVGVDDVRRQIGEAGARCLEELLRDGQTISVTWGRTLADMAARVRPQRKSSISVCEIMGGAAQISEAFAAHEVATRLAERCGGRCYFLQAPVMVTDPATRNILLADESVSRTLDIARGSDIAVLGVGAATDNLILVVGGFMKPSEIEEVAAAGAVANIGGWFVDKDGNEIPTAYAERTIALRVDAIRKIPTKIVVAGGAEKVVGILAAARGGLMDILVTDNGTAESLLRLVEASPLTEQVLIEK